MLLTVDIAKTEYPCHTSSDEIGSHDHFKEVQEVEYLREAIVRLTRRWRCGSGAKVGQHLIKLTVDEWVVRRDGHKIRA